MKGHTDYTKTNKLLLGMSLGVLGLLGITIVTKSVHAASSGDIDLEVDIEPGINITIPSDTVTLNLNPLTTPFASANLAVTVATNNPTGYTLTMSPVTANTTSLTRNGGTETIQTLADLSGGYTEQTFTTNRWGYKLSSGNYLPFTNSNEVGSSNAPTNGTANTVTFASKIDTTQAAGTYELEINFAATANPLPVHTIADGGNMQDVSSVADGGCPSTLTTGQVYTLTDNRGTTPQTYNVARLADGKCWMVENLNLAGETALSATDTDVTSAYVSGFSTSNNLTKTGDTIVLPASSTSGFNTNNYSYVYNSGNKTNNCTSPGCYSYYSWDAATLGSGRSISTENTDAEHSICPKGWKLPTTRTGADSTSDFRALMIALGGSDSIVTYDNSTTPTGATMYSNLQASPYNFLLAGFYGSGLFLDGDSYGRYWSSTSSSDIDDARILYFGSESVHSAAYGYRRFGYSVRCLLR